MSSPVTLERYVGPALHVHAEGAIVLYEGTFDAGQVIPCHVHAEPVISLVLDGEGAEEVAGRTRPVTAQDLLLTPAYAPHGYRFARPGRWFNMQITEAWLARVADGTPSLPEAPQIIHGHAATAWATRVRLEVAQRDGISGLAIDGAMTLMIADLARSRIDAARVRPRWLRAVEEAIDTSVGAPPTLERLADIAGVHPTHLLRTFRRYHGATIANYARQRRVEYARAEIGRGRQSLSAIALSAGFADQAHLTRLFKRAFGVTPGVYARSLHGR